MEDRLRPFLDLYSSSPSTMAILIAVDTNGLLKDLHLFDVLITVISQDQNPPEVFKAFHIEDMEVLIILLKESYFSQNLKCGADPEMASLIKKSEIVFDRYRYMECIKNDCMNMPMHKKEILIGHKFAELIDKYLKGKAYFLSGEYMEAYHVLVNSFYLLGQLALAERGIQPCMPLWKRVKQVEPEILKLFEELTTSEEGLEKRLELLFLASEFLIYTKSANGAKHLLSTMEEKKMWAYEEMAEHPALKTYGSNLWSLIKYLIEKETITTITIETSSRGSAEKRYQINYKNMLT